MIYWIMWFLVSTGYFFAFPSRIIGKKYLKYIKKDAGILAFNHQSNNDGVIIKAKVVPTAKMMGKESLFNGKVKGWFFRTIGAYPVNRGGNDIQAVKTTLKHLKDGKKVGIAPEGTRVKEGESAEFKNGVVMFAIKTDSYIVPMIFRKPTSKPFRTNTLLIGKPFKLSQIDGFEEKKTDKDTLNKATEILTEKMDYLKTVDINEYVKIVKADIKNITKNIKQNSKKDNQ